MKVIPPLVVEKLEAPTSTVATAVPLELNTCIVPEVPMVGAALPEAANVMRSCASGQTPVPPFGG